MKQFFLSLYTIFGFLLLSRAANAQAPLNDECSSAVLITPVPFSAGCVSTVHGTTAGATRSLPDPTCTTVENNDDTWYYFTAQTSSVIIRFSNVINDGTGGRGIAGTALYQGACPSTATGIYCNNLHANGDGYQVINGLITGETYYLRIWSTLGGINRNV